MKPIISIIIVHYQNKKVLFNCLKSIKKNLKIAHQVIVVDNDKDNIGFGAGCNKGAKKAIANHLLFLNPDTLVLPNSIKPLLDYLNKHKKTAAVAPLLLDSKRKPYPLQGSSTLTPLKAIFAFSFINKFWPNNPISKKYWVNVKDQTKPIPVKVLPGSAFLIRKSIFNKFKGFDQKFFLYFEESDLFKRITDKGHQLFILPYAPLIHFWGKSTPKTDYIQKIFLASRYCYLKKHFGLLKAVLSESFLRLSFELIVISLILLIAIWLRFYNLPIFMTFIGDQGRDYLAARDMTLTGHWPLVGIPSSVPWLFQGSFFIWLIALAFKIGHFNPVAPAILTSTIGVLTVYLTYKLAKSWLGLKPALATALIMATSPLLVVHSRMPYHISPIPLFTVLFLTALSSNLIFWSFFLSGVLLQFELTTLPLAVLAIYWFYKQKTKLFPKCLIFFLPFLPKLIYDFSHGFKQTAGFIAWAGYRLLSFLNPASQHGLNNISLDIVFKTIFNYWQKFAIWNQPIFAGLISLLAIFTLVKSKNRHKKLLNLFILINFLAFFIHAGPSEAYFPILLPAFALSIGLVLHHFKKPIFYLGFIVLAIYNSYYLVKHDFIPYGPTLSQRLSVVNMIKSKNTPYKLKNPPTIKFNSYLDNYRYLLWWQKFPEDKNSNLNITIHE
ncbi:MAG: glycosyltransferase [Candidatus Beckwithbacteria bacterium]|nr:glycosyltransferase [Patescibacteria group bacterium]